MFDVTVHCKYDHDCTLYRVMGNTADSNAPIRQCDLQTIQASAFGRSGRQRHISWVISDGHWSHQAGLATSQQGQAIACAAYVVLVLLIFTAVHSPGLPDRWGFCCRRQPLGCKSMHSSSPSPCMHNHVLAALSALHSDFKFGV